MMLNKLLLIVIAVILFCGCAGGDSSGPATYAVTGMVTLGGSAVADATVTFVPSEGGNAAVGTTNASGQYSLKTLGAGDGATPGNYLVQIVKYQYAGGGGADESSAEYRNPDSSGDSGSKNLLPAQYESAAASGLKATVSENAAQNVFNFELEGSAN